MEPFSSLISQTNFTGSAYQLDRLRDAARDHAWEGPPIEDAEFAADAALEGIEATRDGVEPDDVHPEALAFYRARLRESAEKAMVRGFGSPAYDHEAEIEEANWNTERLAY